MIMFFGLGRDRVSIFLSCQEIHCSASTPTTPFPTLIGLRTSRNVNEKADVMKRVLTKSDFELNRSLMPLQE